MARTSTIVWLVSGALLVAACGGGVDGTGLDSGSATSDASTSGELEGDPSAQGAPANDDADTGTAVSSGEVDAGDDDTPSANGPGSVLEPAATFSIPAVASAALQRIAVSPTGDRVAVLSLGDSGRTLSVHDAATGTELMSTADDRLDEDLFWTADGRIITAENFGTVWVWDGATLQPVSEEPFTTDMDCSGGNGVVFDSVAGALFFKSDSLCRLDVTTGEWVRYESASPTTLLAVAIGGNEVYLRGTDDSGNLVLRVLDATTLDVVADEPADGGNPILAASGNGAIEQESGGFGYLVQPSGRPVDFDTSGITTSAGGGYYVSGFDGGKIVISAADGSTIGRIDAGVGTVWQTAWSADDSSLATRTDGRVSVYRFG